MNKIRLRFLGGIGTVTGSCILMEYNESNYYLIDAGMFQNESDHELEENREKVLRKYANKIKIIFITHAHLDHIGLLPEMVKWGFNGKLYSTKATIEILKIMLEDAMKIKGNFDSKIINSMNFFEFDGNKGENHFKGFGKEYKKIEKDFSVTILRSSHILGSCTWQFRWTENNYDDKIPFDEKEWKYLYFTGDIGSVRGKHKANILFKGHQIPFANPDKTIILESTYGGIIRNKNDNFYNEKITKLAEIIIKNIESNKFVLIPAFALDRAQQILVDLNYVKLKHTVDGKRFHEQINYNNICNNKTKNDFILLINENITINEKNKKKMLKEINDLFDNDEIQYQELNEDKQEMLKKIVNGIINIRIGIKSPLIKKINDIYIKHMIDDVFAEKEKKRKYKYLSDEFLNEFDIDEEMASQEQKEKINKKLQKFLSEPKEEGNIIISASGMCDEGSVIELLKKCLKDENSTVILTGYQAKDTNGFLLKNYIAGKYDLNNQKEKISLKNIDLKLSDIKCEIEDLSQYYSGHADQEQLINYIFESNKESFKTKIIINHGSIEACNNLKEAINKKLDSNVSVLLPEFNKWFDIGSGEYNETEEINENEILKFDDMPQVKYVNVDGIQIYFPIDYFNENIQKIADYIKSL